MKQTRADKKEKRQIASFSKRNVNTSVLLPFRQYKNDCFYMDDGGFVDFIKINCKDILSLSEDEKEIINYTFEKFYKTYSGDLKLIGINMPVDTTKNQSYMQHKLDNCKNSVQRRFLLEELEYEKTAQEMITQREFYLCFFFDSLEQRKDAVNECISILGEQSLAEQLTQQDKETIIYQLCNKNVPVDIDQLHSIKLPRQEAIDKYVENVGFDPYLISRIQPRGGISFKDERYISTGTGYEACVHIYDYKINISDYWLNPILNIDNVISVMDISTENTDIVNKNLNKSLDEQESRYGSTDKSGEKLEAKNRYEELESLHFEINNMEEIIKLIHIRLFVSSLTKNELEKKIAGIIGKLNGKGFKGAVFLGEIVYDYGSINNSYFNKYSFLERQTKIIVCGAKPDEMEFSTAALKLFNPYKEINYLFNFVSKSDESDISSLMGEHKTYFSPLIPDCYSLLSAQQELYQSMELISNQQLPERKKDKPSLFSRWRKSHG